MEGRQVWQLVLALGGQFRTIMVGPELMRTGYDMAAALALAGAMGTPPAAVAAFLPIVEQEAIRRSASTEDFDD